jgi:hypothetical protein
VLTATRKSAKVSALSDTSSRDCPSTRGWPARSSGLEPVQASLHNRQHNIQGKGLAEEGAATAASSSRNDTLSISKPQEGAQCEFDAVSLSA